MTEFEKMGFFSSCSEFNFVDAEEHNIIGNKRVVWWPVVLNLQKITPSSKFLHKLEPF